jgi:hypothetical protein
MLFWLSPIMTLGTIYINMRIYMYVYMYVNILRTFTEEIEFKCLTNAFLVVTNYDSRYDMYMYVCVYIYSYMYICMYFYTYIYVYVYLNI